MIDQIIEECKPKMNLSLDALQDELSRIRTGRAHAGLIDGFTVNYYGSETPIKEVASITVPEPSMISVKPWDKGLLSIIDSAIRNSDLGLSPVNDGTQIRLILPPMTEERRKEITGQVKKHGEETRVAIRNIRADAWTKVQSALKDKQITEDDKYAAEEKLNKLVVDMNQKVDQFISKKETEIMKI